MFLNLYKKEYNYGPEELQKNWDHLGQEDPLWAILSDPEKKVGKWDITEFFDTGEKNRRNI